MKSVSLRSKPTNTFLVLFTKKTIEPERNMSCVVKVHQNSNQNRYCVFINSYVSIRDATWNQDYVFGRMRERERKSSPKAKL